MNTLPAPGLVDVIVLVLVALATLRGYVRGLAKELAGVLTVAAALWLGMRLHPACGAWLQAHTTLAEQAAQAVAFLALFVAGALAVLVLRFTVGRLISVVVDPRVDRPLGALAGAVTGCALVFTLLVAGVLLPHPKLNAWCGEESLVGAYVKRSLPHLRELVEELGGPTLPLPEGAAAPATPAE